MKARTAAALVLLVGTHLWALPAPAQAQQEAGDLELQFTGSVLSTVGQDGGSFTSGVFKTKVGYFVTDHVELGAFPSLLFARVTVEQGDVSQTVSDTRFGMGVFGTYSFLMEDATTVPYLGAQFYRIDLTDDNETGWAGVNGGFKFYISRTTAFDLGGNFLMGLGDRGGALLLMQAGVSFLF